MKTARRFTVRGKVQGVGFRYFVIQEARDLDLTGTVRNAPDGSVEVIAEGPEDAIITLRQALERGPAFARVVEVQEVRMEARGNYAGFQVVY